MGKGKGSACSRVGNPATHTTARKQPCPQKYEKKKNGAKVVEMKRGRERGRGVSTVCEKRA